MGHHRTWAGWSPGGAAGKEPVGRLDGGHPTRRARRKALGT